MLCGDLQSGESVPQSVFSQSEWVDEGWRPDLAKNLIWFAIDEICPLKFEFFVASLVSPSRY